MQLERKHVLDVMRRVGLRDRVAEAERRLPDPVDVSRDERVLASLGLSVGSLTDRMGGSP